MKKILITGKSGSGKSIFSTLLSEYLNCEIIDVDKIGHSVYNNTDIPGLPPPKHSRRSPAHKPA